MRKMNHKLFFACDCTNITKPVGLVNNCRVRVEEIIMADLIYV